MKKLLLVLLLVVGCNVAPRDPMIIIKADFFGNKEGFIKYQVQETQTVGVIYGGFSFYSTEKFNVGDTVKIVRTSK